MRILITGGAGFIGCNAACEFLGRGDEVIIFDNLSRVGAAENLAWVRSRGNVTFIKGDVRAARQVSEAIAHQGTLDAVIHLAAQVAVTTSVEDPLKDFEINALGTLNVLQAVRERRDRPLVLFSSTNKVYGEMEELKCTAKGQRYVCAISETGVDEQRPLDFHSPYGCSKGAADQYVHDYGRIYGLRSVVLRQSCIYGNRQFGIEEQGWLAWFTLAALMGRPLTIYGDGRQVRDVLEVSDLVRLYRLCIEKADQVQGQILNVGGGPQNAISINESLALLEKVLGMEIRRSFSDWRPGDQLIFVSNNGKARRLVGWEPALGIEEGLAKLVAWIKLNLQLISSLVG